MAGFGVFQTYRYVMKGRAQEWLAARRGPRTDDAPPEAEPEPACPEADVDPTPVSTAL